MNDIDAVMRRHIGKDEELEIKNEDGTVDKIMLKPLDSRSTPDIFRIAKTFSKFEGSDEISIEKETIEVMTKLCEEAIIGANPTIDRELMTKFIEDNLFLVIQKVIEMNSLGARKIVNPAIDRANALRK